MKKAFLLILLVNVLITASLFSQEDKQVKIVISTNFGDMTAILYNETPLHRDNFVKLVKEGWYEGSPFHRVIRNFMIDQGAIYFIYRIGENGTGPLVKPNHCTSSHCKICI